MKRKLKTILIAFGAILWSASSIWAQDVNMERYITLTVKEGASVKMSFCADVANTKLKIVSGSGENTVTVGTDWTGTLNYTAKAGTMIIYGNISKFSCSANYANVTGIDASHNTQVQELLLFHNSLTTLDVSKNTRLQELFCYHNALTTLDVSKNDQLTKLDCKENSLSSLDVSNNTKLEWLNCTDNSLTTLDISKNTELEFLFCFNNSLTTLDVSKNTKLMFLSCQANKLTTLDVSKNILLRNLGCHNNPINSLDVSHNTQLKDLECYNNKLTTLDVSKNTQLVSLDCGNNSLTTLDISKNTELEILYCFQNNFTTAALDDIYCSLPDRSGQTAGRIYPVQKTSSPEKDKVLATNGSNATARNWNVKYYDESTDITGFTGTHSCTSGVDEVENIVSFAVYPNPVKDILYIDSDKPVHSIRIYNVYGTEVLYAADTASVNVSHLPAGVYMVRVDGRVTRVIKE